MYSRIPGTGAFSAPSGSQIRAASLHPSDIVIQTFSISRTLYGSSASWDFIDLTPRIYSVGCTGSAQFSIIPTRRRNIRLRRELLGIRRRKSLYGVVALIF